MRFEAPLISGTFLRREKRFLVEVELGDQSRIWAHVPNTGALTGCLVPGQQVLLTCDARPGRKTSHTWRFCQAGEHWVCVDTLVPNRLVAEALAGPGLPGLPPLLSHRAEATLPQGCRLDFVGDLGERLLFMEVKSITWVEDGIALFPDGVTSRGRRHLEELAKLAAQGHEAWQVFVVQRPDAKRFRPAADIDPAYARELARGAAAGVNILVLQENVSPPEITLADPLPFDLY
ncbi:MAG: DNA/RNA nuclease SfsA [Desulfobaccales bacterium]